MRIVLLTALLLGQITLSSVRSQQSMDSLKDETTQWIKRNSAKHDLAQNCKPLVGYKNWEVTQLQDCTYRQRNTGGSRELREGRVFLIIPEPERIASWIVNACADARGSATAICVQATACQVKIQSGAQFPVAGIVLEDMGGTGFLKNYPFRDGVTVKIEGIPYATEEQLSAQQLSLALDPGVASRRLKTASLAAPARIQGTSRSNYLESRGKEDVTELKWLDIVRNSFQKALQSDRNELMTAWVKQQSDAALQKQLDDARIMRICTF